MVVNQHSENDVIAVEVSLEIYMEQYAADFCEWVEGVVISVSPSSLSHNQLMKYLSYFLDAYFELRPIGKLIMQPFVMHLPAFPKRRREPDLFIVLNSNPHTLTDTVMKGPADICIEIVSEESIQRDHGEKFAEYEKGGVPEYWIIDPLHQECRFYRLNAEGRYIRQPEDAQNNYQTPALPDLALHVQTLWQNTLPGPAATASAVRDMLASASPPAT